MAGYRNRLVHMYNEISYRELYDILQHKLSDIHRYTEEIMKYISNN